MSGKTQRLSEDGIRALGRAITDKADVLYQAYLPAGYNAPVKHNKQFRLLQKSGVINAGSSSVTLGSSFTTLLKNIDRRNRNSNIAPDIDLLKNSMLSDIEAAQDQPDTSEGESEEMLHLANIRDACVTVSEYLGREMADIEYIINSDLNNTTSIKTKRRILQALGQKIRLQLEKMEMLSRSELRHIYGEYAPAASIMHEYLTDPVSRFNSEMSVHLQKIFMLIDKLKKEEDRKTRKLWLLRKSLRNGFVNPSEIEVDFDELAQSGLAAGGISLPESLSNIEIKTDSYLLATLEERIKLKKTEKMVREEVYKGVCEKVQTSHIKTPPSPEKIIVMQYMKENSHRPLPESLSLNEYWYEKQLCGKVDYKCLLALFLKVTDSDFTNDRVLKVKDGNTYKVFLRTRKPSVQCSTSYVYDAKFVRFENSLPEPSREEIWSRNSARP